MIAQFFDKQENWQVDPCSRSGDRRTTRGTALAKRGYSGNGGAADALGTAHATPDSAPSDSVCIRSRPLGSPFGPPLVLRLAAPSGSALYKKCFLENRTHLKTAHVFRHEAIRKK